MSEQVQLKKAMIIEGILYRAGSVIDKELVPEGLRKRANYVRLDEEQEQVSTPPEKVVVPEVKRLVRKERETTSSSISKAMAQMNRPRKLGS